MNEWRDRGVVLRCGQFRERDKWLKTLCREKGVTLLFAFGASVSKRRFCGCLDNLNTLDFTAGASRLGEYVCLREAKLLRGPKRLRSDWKRAGLATNAALFVETMSTGADSAPQTFELFENLLLTLENELVAPSLTARFFRLRLASILGFAPDFRFCLNCGAPAGARAYFLADEGRFYCEKCFAKRAASKYATPVYDDTLAALDLVSRSDPAFWDDSFLNPDAKKTCARVIDAFCQYHLGVIWDRGRFRRI